MVAAIVSLLALVPGVASGAHVTAPKSGAKYSGRTDQDRRLDLVISGKSVQIVAFDFACGRKAIARTGLQEIQLKHSAKGYRFGIVANGIVSYSDDEPDENAEIAIRGRFSRTAKTVVGVLRVETPRCHHTGPIEWRAKR